MSENKTQPTKQSVESFLNAVENEQKKKDAFEVMEMMKDITGQEPILWGPSLVGFGKYHYEYESGREGDFFYAGFSPRKTALTLYIMSGIGQHTELMAKLGKFKTGKSCLYIKKLDDVDRPVLKKLIEKSVEWMKEKHTIIE